MTERLATLENSLRAIGDGLRSAPRDRWDPAYVVAQVGRDPDTLRTWVGENTAWVPYRGSLRGATGVLMDRRGNSLDRALLLAALLKEAGHEARLTRAELTADQASTLLPALIEPHQDLEATSAQPQTDSTSSLRQTAADYQLDGEAIERAIARQAEGTARLLNELDKRTGEQAARLLDAVRRDDAPDEWLVRYDSALAALRDHWWTQVRRGDVWVDLNPLSDSLATSLQPLEIVTPAGLPTALRHEVVVRVVAERLTHGALDEARILEHTLEPATLFGRSVVLLFWPTSWPSEPRSVADSRRSLRRSALAQDQWRATLVVGDDDVASATLDASTASGAAPGPMGGLGGAMSQALRQPTGPDTLENGVLSGVWLEYELRIPGRAPRTVRRTVFDLLGPAARATRQLGRFAQLSDEQRLTRGFALMMRTEILPLPAQPAPEFFLHLAARSFSANAALLRAAAQPDFGVDRRLADSLVRAGQAGLGPLHVFALLRHDALGGTAFVDRPVVLTRHQYPAVRGGGVAVADAIDIVANEVNIVLTEPDGWAARLAQGVWDTNLEGLLAGGSTAAGNTAIAYGDGQGWRVLTAASVRDVTAIPADARIRLGQELDAGYTVVAPLRPIQAEGEQFTAWWRIDPTTGDALGIGSNGWGQNVDYGMLVGAFWEMAKPFVFAYALCQFVPQMANSLNVLGHEFWDLGLHPRWVKEPPREPGKDFEDVAMENHRVCVRAAIIGGLVATAPILLMVLRAEVAYARMEASLASRLARGGRGTGPGFAAGPRGTQPIPNSPSVGGLGRAPTEPGLPAPRPPTPPPPAPAPRPGVPKAGPAPTPAPPRPAPPEIERLRAAAKAAADADRAANEALGDWVRYRASKPNPGRDVAGDPNWSKQRADELWKEYQIRRGEADALMQARREASAAAKKAQGASGLGQAFEKAPAPNAPSPNAPAPEAAPGCLPKCIGNENPTVPQIQVGNPAAAGLAGLMGGS
jgi:hypothetical protein